MELEKITYQDLLLHIDKLRAADVSDNHPDMLKAKWRLREFLNKEKKSTAIVPKLKTIKTVALSQAPEKDYGKFVILGVVVALAAVIYKLRA